MNNRYKNNENWNSIEATILDLLEQEYGSVHEPVDASFRHEKRMGSTEACSRAYASYLDNPNTVNYNMLITAMLAYQYWTQKRTERFNTEADF